MTHLKLERLHTHEALPAQLERVTASVALEPEQSVVEGGLGFTLQIDNGAEHALTLSNPYELTTYKLTNADGWPVAQRAPSAKSGKVRSGPVAGGRGAYLRLLSARRGDEAIDPSAATVELPAGAQLTYELRVETLAAPPNDADAPTTFVAGAYGFKCQLALLVNGPEGRGGATLVTPETTVTFE